MKLILLLLVGGCGYIKAPSQVEYSGSKMEQMFIACMNKNYSQDSCAIPLLIDCGVDLPMKKCIEKLPKLIRGRRKGI